MHAFMSLNFQYLNKYGVTKISFATDSVTSKFWVKKLCLLACYLMKLWGTFSTLDHKNVQAHDLKCNWII
jgi:hypothetical protein